MLNRLICCSIVSGLLRFDFSAVDLSKCHWSCRQTLLSVRHARAGSRLSVAVLRSDPGQLMTLAAAAYEKYSGNNERCGRNSLAQQLV